jgi:hypothetical protein
MTMKRLSCTVAIALLAPLPAPHGVLAQHVVSTRNTVSTSHKPGSAKPAHGSSPPAVPPTPSVPPHTTPATTTPQPLERPVTDAMLGAVARELHDELTDIHQSVDGLSKSISDRWMTALTGFLGVLAGAGVTGGIAIFLQRWRLAAEKTADDRKAKREKEQADRDFGLAALSDVQAFRTRQLNEFYGPFKVLLSQIRVLRDEFDHRLSVSLDPDSDVELRFDGSGRRKRLVITRPESAEKGFRLIDEMAFVQREYPDLMSTVGEMVSTGDLLAAHVHTHGGLLDPRSTWLGRNVAVYLAHQRVLKEIFERVKQDRNASYIANYSTVYPRALDLLIERDYTRLYKAQNRWMTRAEAWSQVDSKTDA